MSARAYVCACACACACVCVRACVCVYVCACARLQVFMFSLEEGGRINKKHSVCMLPKMWPIMSDT